MSVPIHTSHGTALEGDTHTSVIHSALLSEYSIAYRPVYSNLYMFHTLQAEACKRARVDSRVSARYLYVCIPLSRNGAL